MAGDSESWNLMLEVTSLISVVAFLALMVWGFIEFEWWLPIVVFFGAGIISSLVVNAKTFVFFFVTRPVFSILSVLAAVWCWWG
jgi:hypothetical protein